MLSTPVNKIYFLQIIRDILKLFQNDPKIHFSTWFNVVVYLFVTVVSCRQVLQCLLCAHTNNKSQQCASFDKNYANNSRLHLRRVFILSAFMFIPTSTEHHHVVMHPLAHTSSFISSSFIVLFGGLRDAFNCVMYPQQNSTMASSDVERSIKRGA